MNRHNHKIIFFSPVSYFKGGAERSLLDLLANPHVTPILVAPDTGPILEYGMQHGIPTETIQFGSIANIHRPFSFLQGIGVLKSFIRAGWQLKDAAQKSGARIVHSNGLKAHAINCASRMMGGPKAVLHIRDIPYTRAEKLVWKILYMLSDRIVVVSRACWPDENLPSRVAVIHNGIPSDQIMTNSDAQKESETLRIGFIGRIHPAKGLHLLLEWLAIARNQGHNALHLSIKGAFSEDAPTYEAEIKGLIEKLGISDIVSFKGFIADQKEIYKDLDLVVVPSHIPDPLPRSVMESMAHGVPVAGYPAGGIGEMIIDNETGYFVKDSDSFTRAIASLSNKDKRTRIIQNAKSKIAADFTLNTLHTKLEKLYASL